MQAARGQLWWVALAIAVTQAAGIASAATLPAVADAYLKQSRDANEGTSSFIRVNSAPNRALVRFDQAAINAAASGMVLLSAALELYVESANSWGAGRELDVHRVTTAWTEGGATWNCPNDTNTANSQPDCAAQWDGGTFAAAPTASNVQTDALSGVYVSFNVTADVAAFLIGTPNNGWLLKKLAEGDGGTVDYTSREGTAAQRPRLVLNLAVPTSTATRTATATPTATATSTPPATGTATPTSTPDPHCGAAPLNGCKQPQVVNKSLLLLKNRDGEHDRLVWKWLKGEATDASELGDPRTATTYTVCIYDQMAGVPALKLSALVPPSTNWEMNKAGFKYLDPDATVAGIKGILLKSGVDGKAKIIVKGKGAGLHMPTLPLFQDQQVIVQLKNTLDDGHCWEARYSGPATKSDDRQFKDRGDGPFPTPTASATDTATPAGPTPTATDTPLGGPPTPTATPTAGSGVCGNGFLEPGETCANCPPDCVISPCTPSTTMPSFAVQFAGAVGTIPTTVTVLVGYQSDLVSIPGTGGVIMVRQRVTYPPPQPNVQSPNDLDYALRLVVGRTAGLANGLLATIKFDQCQGAPAATPADFGCTVEACAGGGGPIAGCTCTVTLP